MAKKIKNSKFDETQWLDVLAQGEASAHAESHPDALQIKKVLTANELKESAKIDLGHDKNRLMFAMKKLDNEQKKSFLKSPIPWAVAASLVLGLSLALNILIHQPETITPLAMNEPQVIKSLPQVTEALKAPPLEKAAPSKTETEAKSRALTQQLSQNRLMLADKGPAVPSPNHPTGESDEVSQDIPAPPVAASMSAAIDEADGLPVPPQPDCGACIPPEPDDPGSYEYAMIFSGKPIDDANKIEIVLKKHDISVIRDMNETASSGGPKVVLKFTLPEKLPKDIKSTFAKYHVFTHDKKKIHLEVLYVPYK